MYIAVRAAIFAAALGCTVLVEILAWGVAAAQFLRAGYAIVLLSFVLICHAFVNDLAGAFNAPAVKTYEVHAGNSDTIIPIDERLLLVYPIMMAVLYFMMSYTRAS